MREISATWMRGGTSKCWVFRRSDLPTDDAAVDELLLRAYGSPDVRQVDGIGGGTSTTSKAVVLAPSTRPDVDVEYTFLQVGITEAHVDRGSNCGNCSAVVAGYAVHEGWVTPRGDETLVRVFNTNTHQVILQWIPTPGGVLDEEPTVSIPGVPFAGAPVRMGFIDPAGRTTGHLLPTGRVVDALEVEGRTFPATLVDAGAPVVAVAAETVGLTGRETTDVIDRVPGLLELLDQLRRAGAVAMGLVEERGLAARAIPKLAVVARPTSTDVDLAVRMLSMGRAHPAVPVTGAVALTLAARTPGTVVEAVSRGPVDAGLRLDTPAGVVATFVEQHEGLPVVGVVRTYRRLARGAVLLPQAASRSVGQPVPTLDNSTQSRLTSIQEAS